MRHLWCLKYGMAMALLAAVGQVFTPGPVDAQSQRSEIETLKRELQELRRRDEENRRRIEDLQRKIETLQASPAEKPVTPEAALEKAVQEATPTPAPTPARPDIVSAQLGGARFRLIDISADLLFAVGWSTEPDESLQTLQGGLMTRANAALPCRQSNSPSAEPWIHILMRRPISLLASIR